MTVLCKPKEKKVYHKDYYYILDFVGNGYGNVVAVCVDDQGNLTWFDIKDLVIIDPNIQINFEKPIDKC